MNVNKRKGKIVWGMLLLIFLQVNTWGFNDDQERRVNVIKKMIPKEIAAENRIALVIGNANYKYGALKNPLNDAFAISKKLMELGFTVTLEVDVNRQEMREAILEFGKKLLISRGVGLFYFAGHGMQLNGNNYLIPLGAKIQFEHDVEVFTVNASTVINRMECAKNRLNIIILDACRNNPFKSSYRSRTSGLAAVNAPAGMLIAYAAQPGKVAVDGYWENSPYTKHLVDNISIPGLRIEDVFINVRNGVSKETGSAQIPWESTSLSGIFYFALPKTVKEVNQISIDNRIRLEIAFWETIQFSKNYEDYEEYLKKFPNGTFAGLARRRVEELKSKNVILTDKIETVTVSLRSNYITLTKNAAKAMLKEMGFFDSGWNKAADFENQYELKTINGDEVIIDRTSNLMWHQSGSPELNDFKEAKQWIEDLNQRGYGGCNNWRLPTLEELLSLLENRISSNRFFIAPLFSGEQRYIWTGDRMNSDLVWVVNFGTGKILGSSTIDLNYVRPVRSLK